MYDSIDTILCVYLNICSLQICVQYCIDVVAVVEINSIHSFIHSYLSGVSNIIMNREGEGTMMLRHWKLN